MELIPLFFSQQNGMSPDSVESQGRVETGFKELLLTILGKNSFPPNTLSSEDIKGNQESHQLDAGSPFERADSQTVGIAGPDRGKNTITSESDIGFQTTQEVAQNNGEMSQQQALLADPLLLSARNAELHHQHAQGIMANPPKQDNHSDRILADNPSSGRQQELPSENVARIIEEGMQDQPAMTAVERSMDGVITATTFGVDTIQEISSPSGNTTAVSPPLSYNSSAYTYSLLSIQSVVAANDKTILAYHSRFMAQIGSPSAEQFPSSQNLHGNGLSQQSQANMDLLSNMKAGGVEPAFYDSPDLSISIDPSFKSLRALHSQVVAHQSTILDQIQRLITQNHDSVQIKVSAEQAIQPGRQSEIPLALDNSGRAPHMNTASVPVSEPAGLSSQIINSVQPSVVSSVSETHREIPVESLRESFTTIKTSPHENSNEKLKDQSFQSDKDSPQRNFTNGQSGTSTAAANSAPVSAEQAATEAGFISQFKESTQGGQVHSVTSSSGQQHSSPLHEHEIINQIVERFTLHNRPQTSRLSMQLHPAELGKLKIEIVVKGDTLKANIYAQTSQAGEIIDRNLPRLRALLNSHGISVEELVVSFKSDDIDQFNTHQDQLFHEQPHLAKQERPLTGTSFETVIDDTLVTDTEEQSGVNLTI